MAKVDLISVSVENGVLTGATFMTDDGPVSMTPVPPFEEGEGLLQ